MVLKSPKHKENIKNLAGSLGIALVATIITLSIGEAVLRLIRKPLSLVESSSDYYQFNYAYGIEPKPNLKYIEYGFDVFTNSLSLYGPAVGPKSDQVRIAYMGDSYSVGPGIDTKDNYPTKVTEVLAKKFNRKFDFVIGGYGGSSPATQATVLERKILPLKPNVIVYELYDNDPGDDYVFHYSPYFARMQVYDLFPAPLRQLQITQQFILLASNQLSKYLDFRYNQGERILDGSGLLHKKIDYVWNSYTKPALWKMLEASKQNGASFYLFHIPIGWDFDNEYNHETKALERYFLGTYAKVWADEEDVPYIDMYDTFKENNTETLNELYLPGERGYHLTEQGAQLVTDKLVDLITQHEQF
ncbi:hypothetical protein A2631_02830 [Candidatus Daviesbacteria bacterium RIFCSPHIGHO2_01_FULL_44_29]|uniref:SGNH hydrolase-type esterase domain-containing protein n=1 Tax=Candidatus Daviesbacteria bacterium RIFCSPHIGHO2_02_FULL_43_12 TaxID=1797776 RepID=A0A1F5KKG3_9BACT|nr:MAG: hypothetical protein A2631_02830 [Candidatus Daviesbacteria bacterium RIFCSPHIGHO2_01_FULL_44_29]OGE40828.1 MAG: hypothetical protein A3E86_02520 [Candidatus Daviesbacteria bacterium RIFCSPHIGHO2_12_FULL_47_45]OGE41319.1 MAG: hypothetical protein A3D25_02225 [Candidatus Daviesbacteria bacterium RIFCSPHIGHO2_02_FULL_43_12]OGE69520.1 MAG: hypothetical protein A3B55_03965 [Candidatus Daviesbacteria bacterium RIFCSPLOWO2_01_FULL_43_15]